MTSDNRAIVQLEEALCRCQKAVRTAEEKFQLLTAHLPGVVYTCRNDENYSVIYISDLSTEVFGYSPQEFTSGEVAFKDLIHPDDADQVAREVSDALAHSRQFHVIYRIRHKSRNWRRVEGQGIGIVGDDGLVFLQGFTVDVTQKHKDAEESEVLWQLNLDLAAVETMEMLGQAVRSAVARAWSFDAFFISVRQSGESRVRVILEADTYEGELTFSSEIRTKVYSQKLVSDKPVLILREPDGSTDSVERFGDTDRPSLSLMFAPIILRGRRIGIISVQSYQNRLYDNACLNFLQKISDNAGPAVERVRSEERSRQLSIMGEKLNAATTPEQASMILVQYVDELIGWDACGIERYSQSENLMYDIFGVDIINGVRTRLPTREQPLAPQGFFLRALTEGHVIVLREPSTIEKPGSNAFGDVNRPSASIMVVAMRGTSGITGFLITHSYIFNAYDMDDVHLMQTLANFASSAMERTRAQQNLRISEEIYRTAITAAGAVPYQLDYATNTYSFVGKEIETITGWPAEEFTTEKFKAMVQEVAERGNADDKNVHGISQASTGAKRNGWQADMRIKTRAGEERWISDASVEIQGASGVPCAALGILQDISERKNFEKALIYGSMHDALTGLANRTLLLNHLRLALHRAQRRASYSFAILFLDIDRFKQVNDSLGHLAGDQLLVEIAQRLQNSVRPGDTAARFAGDEFVILLDDIQRLEDVLLVAERILDDLKRPVVLSSKDVYISSSMGIAISSIEYKQAEDLLRDADNALYRAKRRGKGCYEIFDADMYHNAVKTLELESDFRGALDKNEFVLHYQPIIDLATGQVKKFEALVRWNHPTRGMVPPRDFIPMAEDTGLINLLGLWVVEEAAAQLRQWQDDYPQLPPLKIAINLSVRQFANEDLATLIYKIVVEKKISPNQVVLEITETVFLEKQESVIALLNQFKEFGFDLALDDFGTGYSSLSNLHGFPIDWIKIDRSFISKLELRGAEIEIVRAIIQLAERLSISVTAEGVETAVQLAILREMKCMQVQGFFLSKPLPADQATAFLASYQQ